MKRLVALISKKSNNEAVIETAMNVAELLQLEITLCHLVEAPSNWESLGRTVRDNYPKAKVEMKNARDIMDQNLLLIRSEKIKARKEFLIYEADQFHHFEGDNSDTLVISDRNVFATKHEGLVDLLCEFAPIKMIVNDVLDLNNIEDVVLSSDFHTLLPQCVTLIDKLIEHLNFNLNLVYINTDEVRENSKISIENMKTAITENGFRKTSISIFNADCRLKGVEDFASLKGGDLAVLEEQCKLDLGQLRKKHLPIIIIHK